MQKKMALHGQKAIKLRITFRETEASNAIVWRSFDHVENYDTGWTMTLRLTPEDKKV
jgi:hypothetical protein